MTMNQTLTNCRLDELLALYAEAANLHAAATVDGDYKAANRQHDLLVRIYRELKNRGLEAQASLLKLFESADASVRLWAAVHTLEIEPELAERVLEQIAQATPSLARLNAATTLVEWRKGTLVIPS